MNTTVAWSSDSWLATTPGLSRRTSTETIYSIQDKETDVVEDTADTETYTDADTEFEPVTEDEDPGPLIDESTDQSDNEVIRTKVIEVLVQEDSDLELADEEDSQIDTDLDSELDLHDYWNCAQCGATNNNPMYRLCQKCFEVRKNFFPPRPKRKHKRKQQLKSVPRTFSQDSGVESVVCSTDLCQDKKTASDLDTNQNTDSQHVKLALHSYSLVSQVSQDVNTEPCREPDNEPNQNLMHSLWDLDLSQPGTSQRAGVGNRKLNKDLRSKNDYSSDIRINKVSRLYLKRRPGSADRRNKRMRVDYSDLSSDFRSDRSDSDDTSEKEQKEPVVSPLVKTTSAPTLTFDSVDNTSKSALTESGKLDVEKSDNLCIMCVSEPKSGVFVHGRIAHICCCYKCAMKVWAKAKRCPICNCRVSNVLKGIFM